MMLEIDKINVFIKNSHILRNVSIDVNEKEVVCLIGRNGAGKTTTLKTVMGFLNPQSGDVRFKGREISKLSPHEVARLGIGFSPEDSGVFGDLTTFENIEIASWMRKSNRTEGEKVKLAYNVFPSLEQYRVRKGTQISGGEKKMLSVARALALDPTMFLLDECFEGLSPAIIPKISESIHEIAQMGNAILMAESNIYHIPDFTDKLYVIERGEIIFTGKPAELLDNKEALKVVTGVV
jgi:branched-chain amino acid transport system ATP-binding protein